jgi:hypothetical protein
MLIFTNEAPEATLATTVAWGKAALNAADFDVVILDLVTLGRSIEAGLDISRLSGPSKSQIGQLLSANGVVLAIVPPIAYFRSKKGVRLLPYWWSPIPIENELENGRSIFVKVTRFKRYFDQGVSQWRSRPKLTKNGQDYKDGSSVRFKVEPLAASRSDIPVATSTWAEGYRASPLPMFGSPTLESTSGPVISLPEPDKIRISEAIKILLQDVLLISSVTLPPVWTDQFPLQGEDGLRSELKRLSEENAGTELKIRDAESRLQSLVALKKLLYADGTELEQSVWTALEHLGAKVGASDEPGFEDRWFEDPSTGAKAVLEVKGHIGAMKKDDVRQAEEWVGRWYEKKGEVVKGVLFGNPDRQLAPKDRPAPWPSQLVEFATAKGLALVTTTQLFDAIVRTEKGEITSRSFIDSLFSAAGPVRF